MSSTSDPTAALLGELAFARRLARSLVRGDDSEDLVQTTALRFLQRPTAVRHARAFWSRSLRNGAATRRRQVDQQRAVDAAAPAALAEPVDASLERLELIHEVARAVEALPGEQRQVVLDRYAGDLSCAEIARRRGLNASTVRGRLAAALATLRTQLEPDDRAPAWVLLAGAPGARAAGAKGLVLWGLGARPFELAAAGLVLGCALLLGLRWLLGSSPGPASVGPASATVLQLEDAPQASEPSSTADPLPQRSVSAPAPSAGAPAAAMASLTGRLLGPDGLPAPLLNLTVEFGDTTLELRTDQAGEFEGVLPADIERIAVRASDPTQAFLDVRRRLGPTAPHLLGDLRLRRGAAVSGRVVTELGEPIPGVTVSAHPLEVTHDQPIPSLGPQRPQLAAARTDSAGAFTLGGIEGGAYSLWTALPAPGFQATANVELALGDHLDGLVLRRAPSPFEAFRIEAVDEAGAPLELDVLELYGELELWEPVQADSSTYTWVGPRPVRWNLSTAAGTHAFAGLPEFDLDPSPAPPVGASAVWTARVELTRLQAFELEVADAGGRPLPAFEVEIGTNTPFASTSAGSAGHAALHAPPRNYTLSVMHQGSTHRVGSYEAHDGSPKRFQLPPATAVSTLVRADGEPLAGATVTLHRSTSPGSPHRGDPVPARASPAPLAEFVTDASGRFERGSNLGGDGVFLLVRAAGWPLGLFGPYGSASVPEFLDLQPSGRIEGTVVTDGAGVAGREVLLTRGGPDTRLAVTDAAGRFAFEGLAAEAWCVLDATGLDLGEADPWLDERLARTTVVRPGATTEVVLELAAERRVELSARLTVDGAPAAGMYFLATHLGPEGEPDTAREVEGALDGRGELRVDLQAPGTVRLLIGGPPGPSVVFPMYAIDVPLESEPAHVELDVATGSIRFAEADGPLADIELEWTGPASWRWIGAAPLGPQAGALLEGVPLGRIEVWNLNAGRGRGSFLDSVQVELGELCELAVPVEE